MKISIKATGSQAWEEINFLTDEREIDFIRVEDFLISPKAVRILQDGISCPVEQRGDDSRQMPNHNPSIIYGIVDLVKQQALALHGAVEETSGYPPEVLCAQSFLNFIHPEDRDAAKIILAMILQGRDIADFMFRIVKPCGESVPIKWMGTPADRGILAFHCSICELPLEDAPTFVHGYPPGQLLGRNSKQFIAEEDRELFLDEIRQILNNRGVSGQSFTTPVAFHRVCANQDLIQVESITIGVDFTRGRIHCLERVPSRPEAVYHFLYDMLGNILSCSSALELNAQESADELPQILNETEEI